MPAARTIVWLTDEQVHSVAAPSRRDPSARRAVVDHPVPNSLFIEHDPGTLAEAIAETVGKIDGVQQPLTLVIPLQWCFSGVLAVTTRRPTAEALGFAFEEHLPVPLEELNCTFTSATNGKVFALAIPSEPMRVLLDALRRRGVKVEQILVDVDVLAHAGKLVGNVLLLDARWGRLFAVEADGTPKVAAPFGMIGDDSVAVVREQFAMRGLSAQWRDGLIVDATSDGRYGNLDWGSAESGEPIVRPLADLLADPPDARGSLDLRAGPLAAPGRWSSVERLARQAALLLTALLLVASIGMYAHRRALQQHLARIDQGRLATYRQVFAADRLPPEAAPRLASERRRLEGLTRTVTPVEGHSPSPLDTFRDVVAGLPADLRILLTDARLDERQFTLRGQTVEHRDAERIVEAINQVEGMEARPPRTARLDAGGVEFSIVASTAPRAGESRDGP